MPDLNYLGFVNMPKGIKFEQIFESEDRKFLFEEISSKRADPLQVFNRVKQYGSNRINNLVFTNIEPRN